jgi:hypothetical protein
MDRSLLPFETTLGNRTTVSNGGSSHHRFKWRHRYSFANFERGTYFCKFVKNKHKKISWAARVAATAVASCSMMFSPAHPRSNCHGMAQIPSICTQPSPLEDKQNKRLAYVYSLGVSVRACYERLRCTVPFSKILRIFFIYILYLFILQNYTTVSKVISFDHRAPWRTAAVVGHGGKANRCGSRKAVGSGPYSRRGPQRLGFF